MHYEIKHCTGLSKTIGMYDENRGSYTKIISYYKRVVIDNTYDYSITVLTLFMMICSVAAK